MKWVTIFMMMSAAALGSLRADINHDGRVDLLDLAILSEEWLMSEFGPDLIVNGGFDADTDWNKTNATISGGVATIDAAGGAITQALQLEVGKEYQLSLTVTSGSNLAGNGTATASMIIGGSFVSISGPGAYTLNFTYLGDANTLLIGAESFDSGSVMVVDDISVKEILPPSQLYCTVEAGPTLTSDISRANIMAVNVSVIHDEGDSGIGKEPTLDANFQAVKALNCDVTAVPVLYPEISRP